MVSILLTFLTAMPVPTPSGFSERIEARVGQAIITSTDIQLEIENIRQAISQPQSEDTLRKKALENLIDASLVTEYLTRMQMDVSDQEIERRINSIRTNHGASSLEEFRGMLERQGLSFEAFRQSLREQMRMGQFFQAVQRQTLQSVDERDLRSFYDSNLDRFKSHYEIELEECVIPFGENRSRVEALARSFESKTSNFADCVKNHSRTPSAVEGGYLGTIRKGTLREEVEDKIFSANKGEVVNISLPGAVQLLRIRDKRNLGPQSFESVRDEIEQIIQSERIARARDRILADLRATTFIHVDS